MENEKGYLLKKDDRGVAWLTLDRPHLHNAFNDEMIKDLTEEFRALDNDSSVRLVCIKGEGKSFCAGADLNWMKRMVRYSEEENKEDSERLADLFWTINNCSKPVLGKIHGAALGGGTGLVSVCDFALASSETVFGFTEVRLGLLPAVISPFVVAKIGQSSARAFFMSGQRFNAQRAFDMGLVHQVVDRDKLDEEFEKLVGEFLKAGPLAAAEAKVLTRHLFDPRDHDRLTEITCELIARRRVSDEGQEGMAALLEKRKPAWME